MGLDDRGLPLAPHCRGARHCLCALPAGAARWAPCFLLSWTPELCSSPCPSGPCPSGVVLHLMNSSEEPRAQLLVRAVGPWRLHESALWPRRARGAAAPAEQSRADASPGGCVSSAGPSKEPQFPIRAGVAHGIRDATLLAKARCRDRVLLRAYSNPRGARRRLRPRGRVLRNSRREPMPKSQWQALRRVASAGVDVKLAGSLRARSLRPRWTWPRRRRRPQGASPRQGPAAGR